MRPLQTRLSNQEEKTKSTIKQCSSDRHAEIQKSVTVYIDFAAVFERLIDDDERLMSSRAKPAATLCEKLIEEIDRLSILLDVAPYSELWGDAIYFREIASTLAFLIEKYDESEKLRLDSCLSPTATMLVKNLETLLDNIILCSKSYEGMPMAELNEMRNQVMSMPIGILRWVLESAKSNARPV